MKNLFSLLIVFIFSSTLMWGQKKVLGLPAAFERPKDVFENSQAVKKLLLNTGDKNKKEAWIVISDRDKNPVYEEMDRGSTVIRDLEFRELFYVVDERDDWVKIADAPNLNKLKSKEINTLGWVPKDRLLLWKSGLLDFRTNINKKAFLLNRADDVARVLARKMEAKEIIVEFYRDPAAQDKDIERTIYDYFFIFKKENEMFLLAEEAELSSYNIGSKLLGWVDARKVQEWNTRICLEPNFTPAGFDERKNNPELQLKAFGDESNVAKYVSNGESTGLFYDADPVAMAANKLSTVDAKRFPGNLVRYPMFKKGIYDGIEFYKSGVIGSIKVFNDANNDISFESGGGDIDPGEWAILKRKAVDLEYRSQNVNVFFVIEGTDKTYSHKENIIRAMQSMRSNPQLRKATSINYGALVYKDIPEGERIIQFERLSPDLDKVVNFVNGVDFSNQSDQDDYTAFYYGLKQSLKVAGFDDSRNNIIVLLGAGGDFSKDRERMAVAKSANHEAVIKDSDKELIFKNLARINAHLFSIQLTNDNLNATRSFALACQRLILGAAKYIYVKNANNSRLLNMLPSDIKLVAPEMETPMGNTQVFLKGSKPGVLVLPEPDQSLTFSKIETELNKMVESSVKYEKVIAKYFENIILRGRKGEVDEESDPNNPYSNFHEGIIQVISKYLAEGSDGAASDVGLDGVKLSLYTEVYCPVKMKDAKYNLFSFVLFMPEADLLDYQRVIARGLSTANSGAYPEKRKNLHEMYMGLIKQFSGQDVFNGKKAEDFTRAEVFQIIQGIQNEGLDLDVDLNVRIGGILNSKEVSDQEIDQLIQKFNKVSMELERIIKLNDRFEFCMVSDNANRYYWLTMDQVF